MRRLVSPRWIAGHLLAITAVAAFVSLGFWQLRRLDEKRTFNASVEAGLAAPVATITELPDGATYLRVYAEGTYDPEFEALVLRARDGVSGYHVLTPLILEDGTAVLVDRGWVPIQYDAPRDPAFGAPLGAVSVTGMLWPDQEGSGAPDEFPNVVRRIDPEIHAAFAPYALRPEYLVLSVQDPDQGGLPIVVEPPTLPEGPHLGYAVQWFAFAGVVVVGYPILLRRTVLQG
jgi:surfeit locus 1 family protein